MQEAHFASYVEQNYGVHMTEKEASTTYAEHFKLYSGLKPAHERLALQAGKRGYTLTPFGRYRYDVDYTKAINTPVQSTGSDLGVFAFTIIDERVQEEFAPEDAQLIGFVHDAVLVRSRKSLRDKITKVIQDSMEHPPLERVGIDEIPVPLVAEVAKGPTWAQAK
jgi:DNA polymerase I-like protein with 3'-5' exonuclease and polymerase domains